MGNLDAHDQDSGDILTYSVPTNSGYRIINGNQLALAADKKLDFEDATVRGAYASRTVTVTVSDGRLSTSLPVTVVPTDVNEAPFGGSFSAKSFDEEALGASVATLQVQDVDANEVATYSVPPTSGYRIINGNELALAADRKLDFEDSSQRGAYPKRSVLVTVTDKGGLTTTIPVAVVPIDVNEAPFNGAFSAAPFAEEALGLQVGSLSAQDADAGDALTYSVPAGSGYRIIGGTKLALASDRKLDREDSSVRDAYASRSVVVTVTDRRGLTTTVPVALVPDNVNEAPSACAVSAQAFAEEAFGATVGSVSAQDVDAGDTLIYSVPAASGYRIVSGNLLALAADRRLDLEDASVRGSYAPRSVTVTATDTGGLTAQTIVTVVPSDVNEAPTGLQTTVAAIEEDVQAADTTAARTILALSGIDGDPTPAFRDLAYALAPGAPAGFEVVGSALRRSSGSSLDFEASSRWEVPVRVGDAHDATLSTTVVVVVTVIDRNDPISIAGWETGSIAVADLEQAVPAAPLAAVADQDAETPLIAGAVPEFARSNGRKFRFRLTPASGNSASGTADQAKHQLQFDLPRASGFTAVASGDDTLVYRGTGRDDASKIATISYESGNRAILQVIVAGDQATGRPAITRADLTTVLHGIAYRCYLSSGAGVPDLFLEASIERPWEGFARDWTGWRRVQVSTANRRPSFTPVVAGATLEARRGSVGTLTDLKFAIEDDYPEQGATIVVVYPPLHGSLELPDGELLPVDDLGRPFLTVARALAGTSVLPYVLTYRPEVSSTASDDSFIVQVRDGGVPPDGVGSRVSELVPVAVAIAPGLVPSLDAVMDERNGSTATFIEQGDPVPVAPVAVTVRGQEDPLGPWTLFVGPLVPAPGFLGVDAESRYQVLGSDTLRQNADRTVEWRATAAAPWVRIGTVSSSWTGVGRSLAIDLAEATTQAQAAQLVRALRFSRIGRRIPLVRTPLKVGIGFVATGVPEPRAEQISRQAATIGVVGIDDPPAWTPASLVLRTTSPHELVGVSEVRDPDGEPGEADGWTAAFSSVVRLAHTSEVDAADGSRLHRFVWSVRPDQAAGAGISFSDRTTLVRQQITIQEVGGGDGGLAFVSDAPFFQAIGERRFLPLVLTTGSAQVHAGLDLFLTFPAGTTTAQRDAMVGRILPNPASGQLLVDFTGSVPALTAGEVLRCTLVANRTVDGGTATAQQPIMLKVLPPLSVASAAQ